MHYLLIEKNILFNFHVPFTSLINRNVKNAFNNKVSDNSDLYMKLYTSFQKFFIQIY